MINQQLPLEVWSQIFEYACMDDGTTGRSLSIVSRLFYHASSPYRFQSIAVKPAHLKHIFRFLEALQKASSVQRRVRYLFLGNNGIVMSNGSSTESDGDSEAGYPGSDSESDSVSDEDGIDRNEDDEDAEYAPLTEDDLEDLSIDEEFFKSPEADERSSLVPKPSDPHEDLQDHVHLDILMLDAIHAILELCSSTLELLSVSVKNFVGRNIGHAFIFPKVHLPHLLDLTWIIPIKHKVIQWPRHGPSQITQPDPPSSDHPVLFPLLKRFLVNFPIGQSHKLWIEHCCPKLRYLRTKFHGGTFERALANRPAGSSGQYKTVDLHTPSTVELHLIDFALRECSFSDHMRSYQDGCIQLDAGEKCYVDKRVIITVKRKGNWKMTEQDWEERKSGRWDEVGFQWTPCPSYDEWVMTHAMAR